MSRLGTKFGERIGARRQVRVGTVGLAMDYFRFCAYRWVIVPLIECDELKADSSNQSQRLGRLAATLNELAYGMGVRQENCAKDGLAADG